MGREPTCIITDQDPSMKIAIPQVFTTSCHRFCMWHIMEKMPLRSKKIFTSYQESSAGASTKSDVIKSYYGSSVPTEVSVHPPQQARNKGCGKRIKGGKEKSIEVRNKTKRLCRKCNKKGYHDSRNCPLNLED
ncbi:unnamed protein product [Cuscuta europaea]|uniref:MULE transposase domain-containing protein n=1 Tax=Cuscuta europaea TaxID=41803 RepID=A0A9P0YW69_CUSEU|nr:unnamed protein product [Cuscuta europaea]